MKTFWGCVALVCSSLVSINPVSAQTQITYEPQNADPVMQGSASAPVGFFKSGTIVSYSLTQTDEDTYYVYVGGVANGSTTKRPDPNLTAQAVVIRSITGMIVTKRGGPITVNWDVAGTAVEIQDTPLGPNEEYDISVPKRRVEEIFTDDWLLKDTGTAPVALVRHPSDDIDIVCTQQVKIFNEFWMRKAKVIGSGCSNAGS